MHLIRTLVVSSFVLLSSSTLADVVLAESREPKAFSFICEVPTVGAVRCGDADRNVRVGRGKRHLVKVDTITPKPEGKVCFEFFVHQAVSGDELAHVREICTTGTPVGLWANPKEGPVDVFMKVKSDKYDTVTITGSYIVDHP